MIKSYKIRLYPTKEQEALMWKHIGACRYIWNYMLAYQQEQYVNGEKHLSAFDMIKLLTPLKKDGEHEWLCEVSNASLGVVCRDLDKAYKGFFKKIARFPKFKSRKRSKKTYPVKDDRIYFINSKLMHIEKVGKIKYKTDFDLPQGRGHKFTNPRISNVNGKWMLSFGMECENQAPVLTDISMGIDLGVKDLAIAEFNGTKITYRNINKTSKMKRLEKQRRHLERSISRKYEQNRRGNTFVKTNNIMRSEERLKKMYARMTNIRTNYIHQTTHDLVSLLPKRVVMEDLNVTGMMKNRHLSKAIQEQCFGEFIRQMQYKCEWNGIEFVQVGRFYPSSKTCSCCGAIKRDLRLRDRVYVCAECGAEIDRDYNAAINLSRYVA
jgi:putative transposase|nr:MAG TPA: endonuclease [Caudoviricetes sp.]